MTATAGFRSPRVDVLLKLGGSLLRDLDACRRLSVLLNRQAGLHRTVVFPGGGPIDKYIESLDQQLHFPPPIHHQLCARAQDQTGLIFASLCNAHLFTFPVELQLLLDAGLLAVMLPMRLIIELDVFEQSWAITSDTMAAYFARLLDAQRFVILTDVDGIVAPTSRENKVTRRVTADELVTWGRTCVDECLAPYLRAEHMSAYVLNGMDLEAVESWFAGTPYAGTEILP